MNAVIYCRVSSKEQVEGTSLESQELACREYAARNHLNVARVFVERGESAKYADRTQLLELLTFCRQRKHDITQLLVWKVDRLARNVGDHFNIKASLLKQDVRVVSVTEPIDANPEGKLLETILAGFAQFDNDIRAARTLQGMRRKIQEGLFPWKPPLGYKSANPPGSKKTEPDQPDEPTFSLLQQAWREFAAGTHTKAELLRLTARRGVRTRRGKHLVKQSLDHIFSDPFYAGIIRDPWTGEEHTGQHLPMISRAMFTKVQLMIGRKNHSVPHRAVRPEFPLRTFARCPCCEQTLTGAFSRGRSKYYPYYRCFSRDCDSQESYPAAKVHEEFTGFLNSMNFDQHALDHLRHVIRQTTAEWAQSDRLQSEKRTVEKARVQQQQQQLVRMKMNQLIGDEEFLTERSLLAARLAELEADATETEARPEDLAHEIDAISEPLMDLKGTWERIPSDFRQRFQRIILPTGYVIGGIGTAQKGRLFSFFESSDTPKTNWVPLTGTTWNQLAQEITTMAGIFREYANQNQPE